MQSGKPQFGPWLIDQVNSGHYEGLNWVGNNKFRIPWKHNSRRDISDEDCRIFKAWAEASGKIRENPNDRAKWKTNFRCALGSLKQFRLVEDNSKDGDDPHKVYEVLEYNYEDPPARENLIDSSGPLIEEVYNTDQSTDMQQQDLLNHLDCLTLNNQQQDHVWDDPFACDIPGVPNVQPNQPVAVEPEAVSQNLAAGPVPQLYCPEYLILEITIQYRSKEMLRTTVSSPRVQLHYGAVDPDPQASSICFPDTDLLVDHKQKEYTQRILASVQRGLQLEVRQTGVYGVRQDKCHVFASTSAFLEGPHPHPQPTKLPQGQEVELLNFAKYMSDLRDFQDNRRRSPEYTIYLCFGEKFPDGKPLEKKLITVKVVPLVCRYLHEWAQAEGASSLHSGSISLQISNNSLFDLIDSLDIWNMVTV